MPERLHADDSCARAGRSPAPVWVELAALRPAADGWAFPSPLAPARPIDPATAWRWFKAAARRVGGRRARIGSATTLGHASLATTSRYAHARPGESSGDYLDLGEGRR